MRPDLIAVGLLSDARLDHRVDVFNVEVGDGPRTFGDDDDDVCNTDPMRR
jgi:hypothetical protein